MASKCLQRQYVSSPVFMLRLFCATTKLDNLAFVTVWISIMHGSVYPKYLIISTSVEHSHFCEMNSLRSIHTVQQVTTSWNIFFNCITNRNHGYDQSNCTLLLFMLFCYMLVCRMSPFNILSLLNLVFVMLSFNIKMWKTSVGWMMQQNGWRAFFADSSSRWWIMKVLSVWISETMIS